MRICQVVHAVPPILDGVGDYAYQLWSHWPNPADEWTIIARRVDHKSQTLMASADIREDPLYGMGLVDALMASEADVTLLHYVPHTFQRKGVPLWLPKALRKYKAASGSGLVVVFHELFASGPIGSPARLRAPFARLALRQLCRLADKWTTSTEPFYQYLMDYMKGRTGAGILLPIGPNVMPKVPPDPKDWSAVSQKGYRIAIFGSPGTRWCAVTFHRALLRRLSERGEVGSILLIGKSPSVQQALAFEAFLTQLGLWDRTEVVYDQPADIVSSYLGRQDVALIATPYRLRGKSGVYAACAAHGLPCVFPEDKDIDETVRSRVLETASWESIAKQISILVNEANPGRRKIVS